MLIKKSHNCHIGKLDGADSGGAQTLQSIRMNIISNSECQRRWTGVGGATINAGHICVFDEREGKSSCSGDSGGMAIIKPNTFVGVTSWGISTCSGSYVDFIHS